MKILLLFLTTLLLFSSCKKDQNEPIIPDPTPTYFSFDGSIGSHDNSTIITADQNLLICGTNLGNVCLLKISKAGSLIWRKEFDNEVGIPSTAIVQSTDQSFFIGGYTFRNVFTSQIDALLIKTNTEGDTLWTKTYGGYADDYVYYIMNTNDGNLLMCGTCFSHTINSDIYLVKTNLDGDTLWTKAYEVPGSENPFHILQVQNGDILITGSHEEQGSNKQLYFQKLDEHGNPLWNRIISDSVPQWGLSTIELSNGDFITCGKVTHGEYNRILVIKTDNEGNLLWEKEYGDTGLSMQGNSIKMNADSSYVITGTSEAIHSGETGIILLKIDVDGNELFLKTFGSGFVDSGQNVLKDENDDNIITGNYNGNIFMTRTDNNGVFK